MVNLVIYLQAVMMMITVAINHNTIRKTKETLPCGSLVRITSLLGIVHGGQGGRVGILNARQLLIHILVLILIFIVVVLIYVFLIILMR
jgi:hypothetical protein